MRVYIAGKGPREIYLAAACRERGHDIVDHGPWDQIILPLPASEMPEELTDQLPRGQTILCGRTDEVLDALAKKRGWRLRNVLLDEQFTRENAILTAEGAVHAAMTYLDTAIGGQSCLVIGYGRIGRALAGMLRGIGARVTVAARRPESRKAAGENSVSLNGMIEALPHIGILFNTVPAPVLPASALGLLPHGALLLELASPPYGFDLNAARKMGLNAHLESGLPGRYCPRSAAEALLRFMEREDEHDE